MFINNKYYKIYTQIIQNSKNKNRIKGENYYESHHIIPKCLGGTNCKSNLVLLTAKEHFICHHLLTKCTNSNKLKYAFWSMCNQSNKFQDRTYSISSRVYETIRTLASKARSNELKGIKPKYTMTDEHRLKLSHRMKNENPMHIKSVITKASVRAKKQLLENNPMSNPVSRKKCSISKMGSKNPNHIGFYHTPWGIFESSKEASINSSVNINPSTILNYCKNFNEIPSMRTLKRSPVLSPYMSGKTYKEIGFYLSCTPCTDG